MLLLLQCCVSPRFCVVVGMAICAGGAHATCLFIPLSLSLASSPLAPVFFSLLVALVEVFKQRMLLQTTTLPIIPPPRPPSSSFPLYLTKLMAMRCGSQCQLLEELREAFRRLSLVEENHICPLCAHIYMSFSGNVGWGSLRYAV